MKHLKVEMIHDMVCSWCPIGYRNLMSALSLHADSVRASIHFLPYQLNPDLGEEGEEIVANLMRKMHWTEHQVMDYRSGLIEIGEKAGVTFDFTKRTHYFNTLKAHCLMHWAEKFDRQVTFNELLIDAYFRMGKDVGDEQCLLDLCEQAGLDRNDAAWALRSGLLYQEIRHKLYRVSRLAIGSIPTFIFNDIHFVTGSNSVEFFEDLVSRLTGDAVEKV